jgi:hypothetical protein
MSHIERRPPPVVCWLWAGQSERRNAVDERRQPPHAARNSAGTDPISPLSYPGRGHFPELRARLVD